MNLLKIYTAAFCLISLILLQGCVEDDLSVCGVTLRLEYTRNADKKDKFENLDHVNLFVFDSTGVFVGEYSTVGTKLYNGYEMPLNIIPGKYNLVAWGNLCDDYLMVPLEEGVTTFEQAMLWLKRASDTITVQPRDLYHGAVFEAIVKPSLYRDQQIRIDLMKNTNNIKVTTYGLPMPTKTGGVEYNCSIISTNGDYKFDNSIAGTDRLHYIPNKYLDETEKGACFQSEFVTLRELNSGVTGSRLLVSSNSSETGEIRDVVLEEDLTPYLVAAAIHTGDLDYDDEFELELFFDITNGTATIVIGEWEHVIQGVEVKTN